LNALANNHGRGLWATREQRPQAQVIFCIDDREEGFRRHLEELNPRIETLGAAGFFGVAINWRGLDDREVTPLCPVVVTPAHEVREVARPGTETQIARRDRRRTLRDRLRTLLPELRRNLLSSFPLIDLLAPGALLALASKVLAPLPQARFAEAVTAWWTPPPLTEVAVTTSDPTALATPENPRLGFTDAEQADRVAALLRNVGLTAQFAPVVALMGHGSMSQNNPHLAAYDCGACSGRHGGPNARVFAAMANRSTVRALLAERGIHIPADTGFVGAEHNTCDEEITFYDLDDLPAEAKTALAALRRDLDQACALSAHERCRRLASAPRHPTPAQALRHIVGRARDFSQARPELGHATNAAALVGRRSMSQGLFLDRRAFLISYDPTQDHEGTVLEGILLAVGPVGAGINLEYYFSTVNNERLGCGTKLPHNVTGLFAVMEGASSDLRTGLPRQMIEIHEPLRLQIVVEARTEILAAIYDRQPSLRELIGNEWIHLITKDPESGKFAIFDPARGFVPWTDPVQPLPERARSGDWYRGHTGPLPPARVGGSGHV
ncbi:MAG: putative inorganic carbon transporter subunit DabA, partial [Candidatus Competibacteraceae bacterium]